MKRFTVKDFMLYNGPCFSCGEKTTAKICCLENNEIRNIQQVINHGVLDATLKITYSFTLALRIYIETNKFIVSDQKKFSTYLETKNLVFTSNCSECRNYILTNNMEFNSNGYVKALTIKREILSVYDSDRIYSLMTEYDENKTEVNVWNSKADNIIKLDLPLLPLYKFKTRERLINKLSTYVIFS